MHLSLWSDLNWAFDGGLPRRRCDLAEGPGASVGDLSGWQRGEGVSASCSVGNTLTMKWCSGAERLFRNGCDYNEVIRHLRITSPLPRGESQHPWFTLMERNVFSPRHKTEEFVSQRINQSVNPSAGLVGKRSLLPLNIDLCIMEVVRRLMLLSKEKQNFLFVR